MAQAGGCERFLALSASVCQMGLASALKCASEQTESCKKFVSVATPSHDEDKNSQRASTQTEIEGHRAARWQGPPGCPEKVALDCYSGGRDTGLYTLPDRY